MKKLLQVIIVLSLLTLSSFPLAAITLEGRVIAIADGDTFTLLQEGNQQTKIRMSEIDAVETKQPYGKKAKLELSGLIFGKTVTVNVVDRDRYGRTVGRVFVDGLDVNAEMIKRGAAWVYLKYAKDQTLFQLEAQAQQDKRGLWKLPEHERIEPWVWRHRTKDSHAAKTPQQGREGFSCAGKQTCRQMTSCAEARFYLEHCGLSSIDGNHDGIPCSRICR